MNVSKLTLSVDPTVVERAKRYAQGRGTSVSQLVETFLDLVASGSPGQPDQAPPVLARMRGSIRRGSVEDHRRYLSRKYK
ncbi:MAG TPA: DUF6364 family protein [Vicinamibacterales bacterium]|nr:DUF6364 family protein [Vicinamibacterales bacterium]